MKKETETRKFGIVGRFIQKRREELGITRPQLTKVIGVTSKNWLGMVERGTAPFPFARWQQFADALSIPRHEFLRVVLEEKYPGVTQFITFEEKTEE